MREVCGNCQHNSNSRDDEPCCRCDSRQTNADRIRNMSDGELADFLSNLTSQCESNTSCNHIVMGVMKNIVIQKNV